MGAVLCKLVAYCILIFHAFRAYLSRASIRDHVGRLLVLGYYTSSQLILTFPSFRAYTECMPVESWRRSLTISHNTERAQFLLSKFAYFARAKIPSFGGLHPSRVGGLRGLPLAAVVRWVSRKYGGGSIGGAVLLLLSGCRGVRAWLLLLSVRLWPAVHRRGSLKQGRRWLSLLAGCVRLLAAVVRRGWLSIGGGCCCPSEGLPASCLQACGRVACAILTLYNELMRAGAKYPFGPS